MQEGLWFYIGVIIVAISVFANAMYVPHHWLKTPVYLSIILIILWVIIIGHYNGTYLFETAKKCINALLGTMLFGIWSISAIIGTVYFVYGGDKPPPEVAIIIFIVVIGIFLFCTQYMQYVFDGVD